VKMITRDQQLWFLIGVAAGAWLLALCFMALG